MFIITPSNFVLVGVIEMDTRTLFTKEDFINGNFIRELPSTFKEGKSRRKRTRWGLFKCLHCGKEFKSNLFNAKKTQVKYCSKHCVMEATRSDVKGGNEKHPLYSRWLSMKQRCLNPSSDNYKNYGGRGINIEPFLLNFGNYVQYVTSLPNYPDKLTPDIQLDRINNDLGYQRGNLRWATRSLQIMNTRKKSSAKYSKYIGISYSSYHNRWVIHIHYQGRNVYPRTFKTEMEAVLARDRYIIEKNLPHKLNILERATTISEESTLKRVEAPSIQNG